MLLLRDTTARIKHIPASERGAERPAGFWLRPDNRETSRRYMALLAKVADEDPTCPTLWVKLRAYLDGWENLEDEHGAVEFERDADGNATAAMIDRLPGWLRLELAAAIDGVTRLTETDRKNSA